MLIETCVDREDCIALARRRLAEFFAHPGNNEVEYTRLRHAMTTPRTPISYEEIGTTEHAVETAHHFTLHQTALAWVPRLREMLTHAVPHLAEDGDLVAKYLEPYLTTVPNASLENIRITAEELTLFRAAYGPVREAVC